MEEQILTNTEKQMEFDIYWIDDHSGQILSIVNNVFPKLWERGVSQYIIQLDTLGKINRPEEYEETLKNMKRDLSIMFREVCNNIADSEWKDRDEVFNEKKPLVDYRNSTANIISIIPVDGKDNNDSKNTLIDLIHKWSDEKKLKELASAKKPLIPEILANNEMDISELIESFNIPDGKAVALDLCLIEKDDDRILDESIPCLSMAIYYALKSKGCRIFPYTVFSYRNGLINSWQRKYQDFFCNADDKSAIDIYLVSKLTKQEENSTEIEKLCNIVKKEVEKYDK